MKQCVECGKEFKPISKIHICCSPSCSKQRGKLKAYERGIWMGNEIERLRKECDRLSQRVAELEGMS